MIVIYYNCKYLSKTVNIFVQEYVLLFRYKHLKVIANEQFIRIPFTTILKCNFHEAPDAEHVLQ